ncbi:MAG TPA: DUF962 domain-containing protein [Kofleriaceae bacterium]|nr:DUF962 domain-containing protein [Kofleriaceae bacterium]
MSARDVSEPGWKPGSFDEFWPYYVSQHLDRVNRWLHFAGTSAAIGCLAAAPVFPPALLAAPVAGYGMAWIGHFVFERNRPATFGHPLWSLRGDFKMWSLMLRGRMGPELEAARQFTPLTSPA